jgi:ABC-type antimicrobial peptide transport system permease subunit
VIRASIDSGQVTEMVRRAAASIDPNVPVQETRTQTALIDNLLRTERLLSFLSSAFGVVGLVLSSVGLAGLLAYTVARRRNEIGIRMALGAAPRDVVRMVLRDSLWLVGIGVLVGMPAAYGIGRYLEDTLFGLEPADPLTAAAALAVLATVAALAAWLPARRAARIDPMAALRDE